MRLALIAAAIAIPIRYFVAQPFIVRGASMEPNFHNQEYLVIDELTYFLREPYRGEVIVFRYPLNTREYFIKRVVGLPGETVEIKDSSVRIINADNPDGFKLEESYLPVDVKFWGSGLFELKPGEYFVLGDNRIASSDSRSWGTLERKFITGRAFLRAWPVSKFGIIEE